MTINKFFIIVIALFVLGIVVSIAANLIAPMTSLFTLICVAPSVVYAVAGVVNYVKSCCR